MKTEKIRILLLIVLLAVSVVFSVQFIRHQKVEEETRLSKINPYFEVFMPDTEVSAMCIVDDTLWVGGKDGIYIVDITTHGVIDHIGTDLEMIYAAGIIKANDGTVFIGHNAGLTALYSDGRRRDFSYPDITDGRVNCIKEIDEKIYIGTLSGATVLENADGEWKVLCKLDSSNLLSCDPVNVIEKINDYIFYGSYLNATPGGLTIVSDGNVQNISVSEGLAHAYVNAILPISDTSALIGLGQLSLGGLQLFELNSDLGKWEIKETWTKESGLIGPKVRFLFKDSDERIWVTTEDNGLQIFKSIEDFYGSNSHVLSPLTSITTLDGLSSDEVKIILETGEGFYLGTKTGITYISGNTINQLTGGK